MRMYEEYRTTTNQQVYNKIRIHYESGCGWCGLGQGCNKKHRRGYYGLFEKYCRCNDFYKYYRKAKYPNWKLCTKNGKQWMEKELRYEKINYKNPTIAERYPDDYTIEWDF